jgi:SAM-dependent methyltransferase
MNPLYTDERGLPLRYPRTPEIIGTMIFLNTRYSVGMGKHKDFWNKEYRTGEHLALSDEPAEDLEKFCRFLERAEGKAHLNVTMQSLDLGCGNGRNLIYLAQSYGMRGVGYDISDVAVRQAETASTGLPLKYTVRSIEGPLDLPDRSVALALDMMTSHFLKEKEREFLRDEILRVLRPGGWLFFKSFCADKDLHVKRLLKESPGDEEGAYIHPKIGVYEFAWSERGLREFFTPYFEIRKIERSHKHMSHGKAFKRRTITAYLQKPF